MSNDIRDAFFDKFIDLFKKDKKSILLSVDMGAQALKENIDSIGDRVFNVGVSEANAVSVAAGLAAKGYKPFIFGIAAFLVNRARAQIRHDICIGGRRIGLIGSGPGLTYAEDGPSHHCLDDISIFRSFPNFTVMSPWNAYTATLSAEAIFNKPNSVYVRLDKGIGCEDENSEFRLFNQNCWIKENKSDTLVITTGTVIAHFKDEFKNFDALLILSIQEGLREELREAINNYKEIIVLDESYESSGIYSIVTEAIAELAPIKLINRASRCIYVQEKWPRSQLIRAYSK